MGMCDIIKGECPQCFEPFQSQTKLGSGNMEVYEVGSRFPFNMSFIVKEPCEVCGISPSVIIKDNIIERFSEFPVTVEEIQWGEISIRISRSVEEWKKILTAEQWYEAVYVHGTTAIEGNTKTLHECLELLYAEDFPLWEEEDIDVLGDPSGQKEV